jgi:hypothetical protein
MWVRCITPTAYLKVVLYQKKLDDHPYFDSSYQYVGKSSGNPFWISGTDDPDTLTNHSRPDG